MMSLKIVLTIGYDKKPTTLQLGDRLLINKRDGTAGFVRNGTPLSAGGGGDKFIAYGNPDWSGLLGLLSHLGIRMNRISDTDVHVIYELFPSIFQQEVRHEDEGTAAQAPSSG